MILQVLLSISRQRLRCMEGLLDTAEAEVGIGASNRIPMTLLRIAG
jgi:hypothetical protein